MIEKDNNPRDASLDNETQTQADRLVAALESESNGEVEHQNDIESRNLANAIRDSANTGLPESSENLRELLATKLEEDSELVALAKPVKPNTESVGQLPRRWLTGLAIAGSLLLLAGIGITISNDYFRSSKTRATADLHVIDNNLLSGNNVPITLDRSLAGDMGPGVITDGMDDSFPDLTVVNAHTMRVEELSSENGRPAEFISGGEIPLAIVNGDSDMIAMKEPNTDWNPVHDLPDSNSFYVQPSSPNETTASDNFGLAGGLGGGEGGGLGDFANKPKNYSRPVTRGKMGGESGGPGYGGLGGGQGGAGLGGLGGGQGGPGLGGLGAGNGVGGGGFGGGGEQFYDNGVTGGVHILPGRRFRKDDDYDYYYEVDEEDQEGKREFAFRSKDQNNEQYDRIFENQFKTTKRKSALSTFSIDVDTASYANMRRFINSGQAVPPNAIRIEELVNYFDYDYPQPKGDDPFSVNMELATCPWNEQHKILRIGLKGKEIHRAERPASNIVFLLDVSGSMQSEDKLPLLKSGFQMMTRELTENDRVSIVTYAGNAGVALEPTSGDQKAKILGAIEKLSAGGSTNGSEGIELAYQLAQKHFIKDGTNKVILATDGDLNVGITADNDLIGFIKEKSSEGVFLSVLGFGTGNLKDAKMEKLADNGNGMYAYIDGIREAHKVLVENMSGSLVTIAKDVKIQIEFNPAEVKAYRLIGYENRMLAAKDFDDDGKDAGEIGAGHTVTALYELITNDSAAAQTGAPVGLKYQGNDEAEDDSKEADLKNKNPGELLTLALRFKKPDANESKKIEFILKNENNTFSSASADLQFASSVAAYGMLLRGSKFSGNATRRWVQEVASATIGDDRSGYRREFVDLVRRYNPAR